MQYVPEPYGKVVLVPDDFDQDATLERLAKEFNKKEPDFFAMIS